MNKKTWFTGPYRWGQEYQDQLESFEAEAMETEKKPAKPVKLKEEPLMQEEDWYAFGFVLILMFGLFVAVMTSKGKPEPMGPEDIKVIEELEPNAEAKPYGSTTAKDKTKTRDIFLENFSR